MNMVRKFLDGLLSDVARTELPPDYWQGHDRQEAYWLHYFRIKAALQKLDAWRDHMPGAEVRTVVNMLAGTKIPNGPLVKTMAELADAIEAAARRVPG